MKLAFLKKVRVVISLLFFLFILLMFLDFGNYFSEKAIKAGLYLQIAPSLLKFITVLGMGSLGFVVVLLLTLMFGRVYCSTICPLGTFQDIATYFSKKAQKRKYQKKKIFRYQKPYNILRYSLLVITIVFLLGGSAFMLNLLDPYSNFGRITTNLFKPMAIAANNGIVSILESFDLFWIYPAEYRAISLLSLLFPLAILGLVLWLSLKKGRLYCNTVCPVGAFLGFLSQFSLFRLGIDTTKCNNCGLCEWDCKANCIDKDSHTLDVSRCVSCFNCLTVCNKGAVEYQLNWRKRPIETHEPDLKKRGFVAGSLALLFALFGFKSRKDSINDSKNAIMVTKASTIPENKTFEVTPPGSSNLRFFNDKCTGCHLCVSACPTNVLQPALHEYGLVGFMQPRMDYHAGFCNFECKICTDICPTGALLPLQMEEKKLTQLGKAKFIQENCVVETEGTDCGACSEHCPTKAVDMKMCHGKRMLMPEVNEDICIGCGACEYACPTQPYKAIFVEGNQLHVLADKPKQEKLDTDINYEEDFPF